MDLSWAGSSIGSLVVWRLPAPLIKRNLAYSTKEKSNSSFSRLTLANKEIRCIKKQIAVSIHLISYSIGKSQNHNHKITKSIMVVSCFFFMQIMFHYILLFINKVLYYIRNPFTHWKSFLWFCDCDFVIDVIDVIDWTLSH